jgi:hypothetical protein
MLLAVVALVAGGLAGVAAGRGLPARPPRWRLPGLLVVGGALVVSARWIPGRLGWLGLVVGYGALVSFAGANWRRAGLVLVTIGLLANGAVVAADDGMPVSGLPPGVTATGHHQGLRSGDHLTALADDIRVAPLGETVSAGDLLVAVGGAVAAFAWMEPRRRRASRRRAGRSRQGAPV